MTELITPAAWLAAAHAALRIAAIIAGAALILRFLGVFVDRFFMPKPGTKKFYLDEKRARTLSSLLKSIVSYAIYFITIVLVLQEFKVDTTSIIAGAGIIGLAVGVGAQSLIRDVITGFFIILEDQYSIGDYIAVGDMAGTVEDLGFRITKLRDANGVLHIIPNGVISRISNYTRGHMQAVVTVPVAYEADIAQVNRLLEEACAQIRDQMAAVLVEGPAVAGVADLRSSEIVVKIIAKTVPLKHGAVEAALRHKIKLLLEAEQLPLPPAAQAPKKGNQEATR